MFSDHTSCHHAPSIGSPCRPWARWPVIVPVAGLWPHALLARSAASVHGHTMSMVPTQTPIDWTMLIGLTVVLLLIAIGWWFRIRADLRTLEEITRAIAALDGAGRFPPPVHSSAGNIEINRLAHTVNVMIERLKTSFDTEKRFFADASHELRTPLTIIRGNLDLLNRDMDPESQAESWQAIKHETEWMGRLVSDLFLLLQFEQNLAVEHERVDMWRVVSEVAAQARIIAAPRPINVGYVDLITLEGDEGRIKQMMMNLIENAVKYTPEDSTISISLHDEWQYARLVIADTGPGIAEEHLPHLFDRFYRADRSSAKRKEGTGLGLAIVRYIAEAHGGHVTVKSRLGEGTTFTIWLRLEPEHPASPARVVQFSNTPEARSTTEDTEGVQRV